MRRAVWGALFGAACLLAAFLIFIVLERYSDLSPADGKALLLKGFVLAGGILVIGIYPLLKMRQRPREPAPSVPANREAEVLAGIVNSGDEDPE